MSEVPDRVRYWITEFYREQAIDRHEAQKASWGWFGRSQHWLFASWRCPACKAAKKRSDGPSSK